MECSFLSVVGALFLIYHGIKFALQVIQGIKTFVLPSLGFRKDLKSFGSWAESEYNVETRIIVIDFSGGQEIYQDIGDKLKDLEIGILVNNVGMRLFLHTSYFHMAPVEKLPEILEVNILSCVMMTYIVLPMMIARKSGLIINVSSYGALVPNPLIALYSCTKAFMDFFSHCINREYCDKGIHVQSVMPWFVSTKMAGYMPTSIIVPSPDNYVNQALGTIGMEQRTCGYWSHSILAFIQMNLLPKTVCQAMIWKMWTAFLKKEDSVDPSKKSS